ncbi:MAG: ATP-dependent zinc metalloprotease FtsH [Lachnospiraceae bacterium]|nr:ATP-dependent zinc metalloprotease FtsH [Lachnospiraceae bacterium]MDY4771028.1 ATP-dependent zinc metalloprotease FtsH [Lachnospiraceae bacterium]
MIAGYLYLNEQMTDGGSYSLSQMEQDIKDGEIQNVNIYPNKETPTGRVTVELTSKEQYQFYALDVNKIETLCEENGISPVIGNVPQDNILMTTVLPVILTGVLIFFLFGFMNRQMSGGGGGNSKMMNFGKSRARMTTDTQKRVTFKQVAGLEEEKEDLVEVVDFLKSPQKYTKLGARIPKGVLLVGPPGTGKTLLAKAVAGEAGVPFFSISGSDFVEMFVGVGASRVRDLFEEGKKNAPCIIFIDEIDAVARQRGTGMGGGHDEREQTLNQLLVEMDGFGVNEGIIVMAATNRVDILDPAILRPGRFDRKVAVGRPDIKGREEILKVHANGKPLGDDVDLQQIAQTTAGFTGADLENLLNEAAILAAKDNRAYITQADIKNSFIKVGIGAEKKSRVISEKEKRITAYHEAGHAILFHVLPDVGPVYTVSIIPTGIGAAGYTMPLPEKDEMFNTRGKMIQDIEVALGGRIAEELVFDDITTGASNDIKQATNIAKAMVMQYGMSEKVGLVAYGGDQDEVFIGRDLAHTRSYSESVATSIDDEIRTIIDNCYQNAKAIILEHRDVLEGCAQLLLEKEKIGRDEFEALFVKEENSIG